MKLWSAHVMKTYQFGSIHKNWVWHHFWTPNRKQKLKLHVLFKSIIRPWLSFFFWRMLMVHSVLLAHKYQVFYLLRWTKNGEVTVYWVSIRYISWHCPQGCPIRNLESVRSIPVDSHSPNALQAYMKDSSTKPQVYLDGQNCDVCLQIYYSFYTKDIYWSSKD